jgi:hypothetical protein
MCTSHEPNPHDEPDYFNLFPLADFEYKSEIYSIALSRAHWRTSIILGSLQKCLCDIPARGAWPNLVAVGFTLNHVGD